MLRIRDPWCLFDSLIRIRDKFLRIPDPQPSFDSLLTIFWVQNTSEDPVQKGNNFKFCEIYGYKNW
jgi:hypothetical protein